MTASSFFLFVLEPKGNRRRRCSPCRPRVQLEVVALTQSSLVCPKSQAEMVQVSVARQSEPL